jgi:PhnB protein
MAVKPIPEGYHTVTPYLIVEGAQKLIDFLKQGFDAAERFSMPGPDGKIGHAEVQIGNSVVMLADASPRWKSTKTMLYLYVEDVDAVYKKAVAAGGKAVMEPANQFYGDRSAGVEDAFGNYWGIATHVEDVPMDELERRAEAFRKQQQAAGKG